MQNLIFFSFFPLFLIKTLPLGQLTCMAIMRFPQERKRLHKKYIQMSDKHSARNRKKWSHALVPCILHRMRKLSHVTHIHCHHGSITVFVCGFWPTLGLVGKQRQACFGPHRPLQGVVKNRGLCASPVVNFCPDFEDYHNILQMMKKKQCSFKHTDVHLLHTNFKI